MDYQQIQQLQSRIGSSFLRGYFPTEQRALQNQQRLLREVTTKETSHLRAASTMTGRISQKLYRSLTLIANDIDELLDSMNNVNNAIAYGDLIMGNADAAEQAMGGLGDFMVFRRQTRAAREQARVAQEQAKAAKQEAAKAEEQAKKSEAERKSEQAKSQARDEKGRFKKLEKPQAAPESFKLEEPKATTGSKITGAALKGVGVFFMAKALWDGWSEITALDPTMPKNKYKAEVAKIIVRISTDVGLAWIGAFAAAAVVGTFTAGVGAIPAFLIGLVGGTVAQVTLGDSVNDITDGIIDYLWQGTDEQETVTPDLAQAQSILQQKSTIQTPPPTPTAETGKSATASAAVPPPTPPTPTPKQQVASTVGSPPPVPAPDVSPYSMSETGDRLDAVQREAEQNADNVLDEHTSGTVIPRQDDGTKATITMGGSGIDYSGYGGEEGPGLGSITTSAGRSTQVHEQLVPNFQGFINALESTGYKISSLGGVAKRNIAGKNIKSWHYWGTAIDINPGQNPHLKDGRLITDMPPNVGELAAQFGLGWGGNWSSSKDTMHFSAAMNEGGSFNIDRTTGQIMPMAEGGVVTAPTLALIGEGGEPEYVVPHSKVEDFAHEMMASPRVSKTKKHTHVVVMPIYM